MTGKDKKQSRRDFLSAGRAIRQSTAEDEAAAKEHKLVTDCVQYFSHQAMACDFEVYFNDRQYKNAADIAFECFESIDQTEERLSVYRPHSEISQFNELAKGESNKVSPQTIEVLQLGRELTQTTEGAFDMSSARLSDLWGFSRRAGTVPATEEIENGLRAIGNQLWLLDNQAGHVTKMHSELKLNLGAIGKGFSVDQCQEVLDRMNVEDCLIHAGNSSVLARGSRHRGQDNSGWLVGIQHPVISDKRAAHVVIHNQALATSGTRRQGFVHRGKWYGHIIDPRNGFPADQVYSCTVITKSAAVADALATAFYVMGWEETEAFCRQRPDIGVIMIVPREKSGFTIHSLHLSDQQFQVMNA